MLHHVQDLINYQTSYIQDKYIIFSDNLAIGIVLKTEWFGSIIESNISGRKLKLIDKGFIKPTITIVDKKTNQVVGSISISNLLTFFPLTILTLSGNSQYRWTSPRILDKSWQWINIDTAQTAIKIKEITGIFKQQASITIIEQNDKDDLLIAVGIHIRNVVERKAHLIRLMGLLVLVVFVSILFW